MIQVVLCFLNLAFKRREGHFSLILPSVFFTRTYLVINVPDEILKLSNKFFFVLGDPAEILKQYVHYNTSEKCYLCTICQKSNAQKPNIMRHIESIHFPNAFVYTCQYCLKQFSNKNIMYKHVSNVHRGRRDSVPKI